MLHVSVWSTTTTQRVIHTLHTIKTQHVKKVLVLPYLNTIYAPWYCSTQTQYHHQIRYTVIAQERLRVAQTQLRPQVWFPSWPPTLICTSTITVIGFEYKFPSKGMWLTVCSYIDVACVWHSWPLQPEQWAQAESVLRWSEADQRLESPVKGSAVYLNLSSLCLWNNCTQFVRFTKIWLVHWYMIENM